MSEELNGAGDAGTGAAAASSPADQSPIDEHTTEPNAPSRPHTPAAPADGKWRMPEPKFQQTSGYLPQGYLQEMQRAAAAAKAAAGSEDTTREQVPLTPIAAAAPAEAPPASPPPPVIEPQPDLVEELIFDEPQVGVAEPAPGKRTGPTALMFVLGIVGLIVFVVVFLAAVWYFYSAGRQFGPFN